ncbi:MAG: TIGR03085 family metal-binding protein [Brevundimonas sp.]
MTWHPLLRRQLADDLLAVRYDSPTLCEGWQARHLAAHVVLRESSLVVAAGIVVPALAAHTEAAIEELAQEAGTDETYRALVERVAAGAPRWSPVALGGDAANLVELFVHAEDVRRGAGPVPPRELEPGLADALWSQLLRTAGMRLRGVPVGVVLVRDDGARRRTHKPSEPNGTVVVRGAVPELVLWANGRGAAADVRLEGDAVDLEILSERLPVA